MKIDVSLDSLRTGEFLKAMTVPAITLMASCGTGITSPPVNNCENMGWMTEDLTVTHYRNGDSIPYVADPLEWSRLKSGAWCFYGKLPDSERSTAVLYNWYALADSRGVCPQGWHVPTNEDWEGLISVYGGNDTAGAALKSSDGWDKPGIPGTNVSGFTALPVGNRKDDGTFNGIGQSAPYWTMTGRDSSYAIARFVSVSHSRVGLTTGDKRNGLACRCIRNTVQRQYTGQATAADSNYRPHCSEREQTCKIRVRFYTSSNHMFRYFFWILFPFNYSSIPFSVLLQ